MAQELEEVTDLGPAIKWLKYIHEGMERINNAVQQLTEAFKPGPEHWRPIQDYPEFDWSSISAEVLEEDEWGATVVRWNSKIWKRRAPENEYGAAIWFSRAVGKENNKNVYATLIMFEDKEISTKVKVLSGNALQALKTHGCKPRSQRDRDALQPQQKPQAPPPPPALPPKPQTAPQAKANAPKTQAKPPQAQAAPSGIPAGMTPGCPEHIWRKALAFVAIKAVHPDSKNHCWKVGVPPNPVYTIEQINDKPVCDCDDYISAAEREGAEVLTCAHIEGTNIFKAERAAAKKNEPQRQATR